jgi:hypothetical protein
MRLAISLLVFLNFSANAQKVEKVDLPRGVVYNYCEPALLERAKTLITNELSDSVHYNLDKGIMIVGPSLWMRYKDIPELAAIENGNVSFLVDKKQLAGKMTQSREDFKKVWNQLRSEIKPNGFTLRKLNSKELQYYWAVISFDIDEPLLIAESGLHKYIINLSPKDLTLVWLDEVPAALK